MMNKLTAQELLLELIEAWDNSPTPSDFIDTDGFGMIKKIRDYLGACAELPTPGREELLGMWTGWNVSWDVSKGYWQPVVTPHPEEYARAVLERFGSSPLQPIPLSEREPTDEDKSTQDKEAWYWDPIAGCWFCLPGGRLNTHYTHWLPYSALPDPTLDSSNG